MTLNATANTAVAGSTPAQFSLANLNVSYFVGLNADENYPSMLLCGDRNIYGSQAETAYNATVNNGYGNAQHGSPMTMIEGTNFIATATAPAWTGKIHQSQGNLLLCDASVQQISSSGLRTQLRNSGDLTTTPGPNTLLYP